MKGISLKGLQRWTTENICLYFDLQSTLMKGLFRHSLARLKKRWEMRRVWTQLHSHPGAEQALPLSAATLQQAATGRAGPDWSTYLNTKVFKPVSPLSVHVGFSWIRIRMGVHLRLSIWLSAFLNWSLKSWRNLIFMQSELILSAYEYVNGWLLLINNFSPLSQNGIKVFFVHSVFSALSFVHVFHVFAEVLTA